jgi:type I restriction enzyme S subunit
LHRAKANLREVDERSVSGDEELLSVSHKTGVTPRSQKNVTMFMAESYGGHKTCKPGDIVVNTLWAWMAALGASKHVGIVSPAYGVYRQRAEAFDPRYLDYLLRTETYRGEYLRSSRGITTSRLRLYPADFLNIPFVQPPLDEQRLIVRFLDWHGAMTGKLIRAKRGLLALIAEQREVLTRQALEDGGTKPMRFSRVAQHVFRSVDRSEAPRFVTVGLFNRGRGIFHKPPLAGNELGLSTFSWVEDGDLVFSGQFAWEGAVAIAGPSEHGCIASHRYHIVRGDPRVASNTYLWCLFRSSLGQMFLNEHSRGAAGRNRPLNINYLMKEDIPIANPLHQARLKEFVAHERRVMEEVADFVSALQEFGARLIADVVTGQLDVRAAAASLPETGEGEAFADVPGDMDDEDEDNFTAEPEDA